MSSYAWRRFSLTSFANACASGAAGFTTPKYPFGLSPTNPFVFASSTEMPNAGETANKKKTSQATLRPKYVFLIAASSIS
jgi:hypothetical protein